MPHIDLNCDLGEGCGHDDELMTLITSASIACGGHAGDEAIMRTTVRKAQEHGVVIGAHPGFVDREHFGRRELALSAEEIVELVQTQVRVLQRVAAGEGAVVRYVKPHGALYNMAARTPVIAEAMARAVAELRGADGEGLALYGLSGGELLRAGRERGLVVKGEVFADRTYQEDGSLTPRLRADALIEDEVLVVGQALWMVRAGRVKTTEGAEVTVQADTLCLHGDGAQALALARSVRVNLERAGVEVKACV